MAKNTETLQIPSLKSANNSPIIDSKNTNKNENKSEIKVVEEVVVDEGRKKTFFGLRGNLTTASKTKEIEKKKEKEKENAIIEGQTKQKNAEKDTEKVTDNKEREKENLKNMNVIEEDKNNSKKINKNKKSPHESTLPKVTIKYFLSFLLSQEFLLKVNVKFKIFRINYEYFNFCILHCIGCISSHDNNLFLYIVQVVSRT